MNHNDTMTDDEIWEDCIREYESPNFIVKALLTKFFGAIESIVKDWSTSASVLEVGCGAGRSSIKLNQILKVKSFEASEFDERYVARLLKENHPFKISQESVYQMKRPDSSVDHLIMLEVLEHLENPEEAIKELLRVSKKSVLLSVPHEPIWCALNLARGKYLAEFGNTPGHINHWNRWTLIKMLSKYGKVKQVKMPLPWLIVEVEKARS